MAGRTFGAIPPTAMVMLGTQRSLGAPLQSKLFSEVGSFGTVALRLFFAAVVLTLRGAVTAHES